MPAKKTPKVAVTRKFLTDLANDIYNPKTRRFLRLCDGALQNGPDPTDDKRPMHCGLGELYFAMTGKQPEEVDDVSEDDVVNLAVELSPLNGARERAEDRARKAITDLDLPEHLSNALHYALDNVDDEDIDDEETQFRAILDEIPGENDDGCGHHDEDGNSCTIAEYRDRSKRVASSLREAAKLLPR